MFEPVVNPCAKSKDARFEIPEFVWSILETSTAAEAGLAKPTVPANSTKAASKRKRSERGKRKLAPWPRLADEFLGGG